RIAPAREATQLPSVQEPAERGVAAPFALMVDALRAHAEALQRIDVTQRRLVDSLERQDRSSNVVASTRALNETFKGLGEIQRGLLDAVVKDSGRGKGLPFAFVAIALLAGLLAFVLFERWTGDRTVGRDLFEEARKRGDELAAAVERSSARETELVEERRGLAARVADLERAAVEAAGELRKLREENASLAKQADASAQNLENYLQVKDRADRAGVLELEVADLQRRVRDAEQRWERAERERERLATLLLDDRLENRNSLEAEKILEAARAKGVLPADPPPAAEGEIPMVGGSKRALLRRINRLLQRGRGTEVYEALEVGAIRDGTRLLSVKLGRYDGSRLLDSIEGNELEIVVDVAADTAELRFSGGHFAGVGRPGEKVPFPDGKHAVLLKEAGVKEWLAQVGAGVSVGLDGRLTWKTGPS
ncbi:MAG: hypothetical protein ACREID_05270, partial [Planctomycetota bacterium]